MYKNGSCGRRFWRKKWKMAHKGRLCVKKNDKMLCGKEILLNFAEQNRTTMKQIYNGRILTPEGWLKGGSVITEGNKIVTIARNELPIVGAERIDAKGGDIVPGGIEQHCHGGGGRDFMEGTEEAFRVAVNAHMQHGTTSIFPTLSSSTRCRKISRTPIQRSTYRF